MVSANRASRKAGESNVSPTDGIRFWDSTIERQRLFVSRRRRIMIRTRQRYVAQTFTLNIADFSEECLAQYDRVKQHPDDFLVHQFHLNPDLVLEKLDAQATARHKDRVEVLDLLKNGWCPVLRARRANGMRMQHNPAAGG
jgi:hypothetical protein